MNIEIDGRVPVVSLVAALAFSGLRIVSKGSTLRIEAVPSARGSVDAVSLCEDLRAVSERAEFHATRAAVLYDALRDLVNRCDGPEGVRADGSNICTANAHAALGDFAKGNGNG